MVETDTLFQTKTAENHTLWRRTYPYKGLPPLPPGGEKFVADYEASEPKKPSASKSFFL